MKVKELMEILSQLDQEREIDITCYYPYDSDFMFIDGVAKECQDGNFTYVIY